MDKTFSPSSSFHSNITIVFMIIGLARTIYILEQLTIGQEMFFFFPLGIKFCSGFKMFYIFFIYRFVGVVCF